MVEANRERAVAAIGVFDGVHLGHQALIARVREGAAREGALAKVITFDPPPREVLGASGEPSQITTLEEKRNLIAALGVEHMFLLPFSAEFAALEAREFLEGALLRDIELVGLVVGDDFRFGAGCRGDIDLIRRVGRERGFWVEGVGTVTCRGERISSTRIRRELRRGHVAEATQLLGRPFALSGRVIRGRGVARRELVPTANLELPREQLLPAQGVYSVSLALGDAEYLGVANVGPSPTLDVGDDRLIEVHVLDYEEDLLGATLHLSFLQWLRGARRFEDLAALKRAITQDIERTRRRGPAGDLQPPCGP